MKLLLYISLSIALIVLGYFVINDLASNKQMQYEKKGFTPKATETAITEAALEVAKEVFPDLNPKQYHDKLDQMAEELRFRIGESTDPDFIIRAINTYLFLDEGYCYDNSDFFGRKAENCFLNGILDTEKGACFTMPLLYLCLAERLGLPICGVNAPQHFFLRWDDGNYRSNIEATGGGGEIADEQYIAELHASEGEIANGCFLRNLSTEEVIGNMYEARAGHYVRKGETEKAIRDFKKALELNPSNVEAWQNLADIYRKKGEKELAGKCLEKCRKLGCNFERATADRDMTYIEHFIKMAKQRGLDTSEVEALREKLRWEKYRRHREEELASELWRPPQRPKDPGQDYAERYMAEWRRKHGFQPVQTGEFPPVPGGKPHLPNTTGYPTSKNNHQPHVPTPPHRPR